MLFDHQINHFAHRHIRLVDKAEFRSTVERPARSKQRKGGSATIGPEESRRLEFTTDISRVNAETSHQLAGFLDCQIRAPKREHACTALDEILTLGIGTHRNKFRLARRHPRDHQPP
jgi:hypothetical protein